MQDIDCPVKSVLDVDIQPGNGSGATQAQSLKGRQITEHLRLIRSAAVANVLSGVSGAADGVLVFARRWFVFRLAT